MLDTATRQKADWRCVTITRSKAVAITTADSPVCAARSELRDRHRSPGRIRLLSASHGPLGDPVVARTVQDIERSRLEALCRCHRIAYLRSRAIRWSRSPSGRAFPSSTRSPMTLHPCQGLADALTIREHKGKLARPHHRLCGRWQQHGPYLSRDGRFGGHEREAGIPRDLQHRPIPSSSPSARKSLP